MERKFSVVIPTMMKCPEISNRLLNNLYNDEAVGEIILIDNSETFEPYNFTFINSWNQKIKPVQMDKNMYVNPSWNYGVSKAKYDYVALLNDDIIIPDFIFSSIAGIPLEQIGILGAYEPILQPIQNIESYTVPNWGIQPINTRWNGFGIFMVFHKKNYYTIPEQLKVWTGDDYIFHRNRIEGKQNGFMMFPIRTNMSITSNAPEFDPVKEEDLKYYELIKQQYGF